MSVEEAELPALLKIAEALKVIFMIISLMTLATMTMTMTLIMMMIFQVKGLVESEEERQGGGSAKATPVIFKKIFTPVVNYLNI